MSAWLCSDQHFAFVARAAVLMKVTNKEAEDLARLFSYENHRSLAARYGDPMPDDFAVDMTIDPEVAGQVENPAYVVKQAVCLDYQACEHREWRDSDAAGILDALRYACGNNPAPDVDDVEAFAQNKRFYKSAAYQDAPWGIPAIDAEVRA